MNILSDVNLLLSRLSIPVETGSMKQATSDKYIVLVPLADSYPVSADNLPIADVQELRITIFSKENYIKLEENLRELYSEEEILSNKLQNVSNDFCITERKYNGYDADTGYYQYTIDVAKNYEIEEDIY